MKTKKAPVLEKKSLKDLQREYDDLETQLEEYLLILGADGMLVREIIADLKEQMCTHADENVNAMIADLINLENAIMFAKEEEEKARQSQPQ